MTLLNRIVRKRPMEKVTIEKTPGGNKEACVLESGSGTFQAEGRPKANTLRSECDWSVIGTAESQCGCNREKREGLRLEWEQGPGCGGPSWSYILIEKETQGSVLRVGVS